MKQTLRHHGFPSPLLDWTASPYVAAFFAFNGVTNKQIEQDKKVKIYTYQGFMSGNGKTYKPAEPYIESVGPNLKTHKRHYTQQCWYTFCVREENRIKKYSRYEDVIQKTGGDRIQQYVLPCSLRDEFLRKLDGMNINAFTLFENEEGLMSMLSNRLRISGHL